MMPSVVLAKSVLDKITVGGRRVQVDDPEEQRLARTLQKSISYRTVSWEEVIAPILAQREEQIKAEQQKRDEENARALEAQRKQAQNSTPVQARVVTPTITGGQHEWLIASGIPESEWAYVDYIVRAESGWNPNAVNRSSGACGLGQQLPCGKWAGTWNDPVAALVAMHSYVNRYGGWAGAYNFWLANHYY